MTLIGHYDIRNAVMQQKERMVVAVLGKWMGSD
jgi:hypothetical protein